MPEPTRSRLMQVRSGSVALDEVPEELDLVVGRLERLAQSAELRGCVKLYVPDSRGPWRIILRGDLSQPRPALFAFAFGEGHPRDVWHPSVYQVADRRLHGPADEG